MTIINKLMNIKIRKMKTIKKKLIKLQKMEIKINQKIWKNKLKKRISKSAPKDYNEQNFKEINSDCYTENVTNFNHYYKDLDIITKYIIKSKSKNYIYY